MLFAQMQIADPPTGSQLVTVLLGVLFISGIVLLGLTVAEKIQTLFFTKTPAPAPTPPDEQYVTTKQLNEFKKEYQASFDTLVVNITHKHEKLETKVETTVTEKYERLVEKIESVLIKLERFSTVQELFRQWHEANQKDE